MNGRNARRERYEDIFFQVLLDEMLANEESEGNVLPFPEKDPEQERREKGLLQVCERTIQQERSRIRHAQFFHRLRHRAAQFAAVLAVTAGLTGVVLASNEDLRVDAINWVIEVYPESTKYIFHGPYLNTETQKIKFKNIELAWIPTDFEISQESLDKEDYMAYCDGTDGAYVIVTGTVMNPGTSVSLDTEDCEETMICVNEYSGTFYDKLDGSGCSIIWTDRSKGTLLQVYGEKIDRDELLMIAENIKIEIERETDK